MEVECIICRQPYEGNPVPDPLSGAHFWTCSDSCQAELQRRGGLKGLGKAGPRTEKEV